MLGNTGQAMAYYITTNLINYTTNSVTISGELAGDPCRQFSNLEKFIGARYVINGQHGPIGTNRWDTSSPGYNHWDTDLPQHTFVGLIPGSTYSITVFALEHHVWVQPDKGVIGGERVYYNVSLAPKSNTRQVVFTKCATTPMYASNIKDTKLTVNWSANGNSSGVTYTLERRLPGNEWSTLLTKVNYFNYADSGLTPETTYEYRITANHTGWGAPKESHTISQIMSVTTTADPAVAAAQEAATKAEAARTSALQASVDSREAKNKATEAVELIKNLKTNFTDLEASFSPTIISVKGRNNATATTGNAFSVDVTASNATYFRAGVNGNYTAWQSSPRIDNISLPNSGINAIEVQAKRSNVEDAPVASGYITVFKIN